MAPAANFEKVARRLALSVTRALEGHDPGAMPTAVEGYAPDAVFNMETVLRVAVFPPWSLLGDATVINATALPTEEQLTLPAAVAEGLRNNFGLQSARLDVPIAAENVFVARAELVPQLDGGWDIVALDKETTDAAMGARRRVTWGAVLELSQVVYAEAAWANLHVQKLLAEAAVAGVKDAELEVVRDVAGAYLDVLQASNRLALQSDNTLVSKQNLDLAAARRAGGGGSEADVKRWESQLALDKMDTLDAEAALLSARRALNRMLGRPLDAPLGVVPMTVETVLDAFFETRLRDLVGDAGAFERFAAFLAAEVSARNPQLRQIALSADAQARQILSIDRQPYTPQFVLKAGLDYMLRSWGDAAVDPIDVGGQSIAFGAEPIEAPTWTVSLSMRLPLFQGLGNYAEARRERQALAQLRQDRRTAEQGLETQVRIGAINTGRRLAKIELARRAAAASQANLRIVRESYAAGGVGIAQLIDAQAAALRAEILAANTVYELLSAWLDVERARGAYLFLATPEQRDAFLDRARAFVQGNGHGEEAPR